VSGGENPGDTIVSFKIKRDGTVEDITVIKSSGEDDLDQATIRCAETNRYEPATRDGQPVEVPWKFRVDWAVSHYPGGR
jgi:TonB family protein